MMSISSFQPSSSQSGAGQRELETRVELTPQGILTSTLSHGVLLGRTLQNGFGETTREDKPDTRGGLIATRFPTMRRGAPSARPPKTRLHPRRVECLRNRMKTTNLLDPRHPEDPRRNHIAQTDWSYRTLDDGIYRVEETTSFTADGNPLTQTHATLVSRLSPELAAKTIATDAYGHATLRWQTYGSPR